MLHQGSRQRENPCGSVDFRMPQHPLVVRGWKPALPPSRFVAQAGKSFYDAATRPTGWSFDCRRQEKRSSKKGLPACAAGRRRRGEAQGKCAILTCRWSPPRAKWRFPATSSGLRLADTFHTLQSILLRGRLSQDEMNGQSKGIGKITATTQTHKKLQ